MEETKIPQLTLTPDRNAPAYETKPAIQETPAAPEAGPEMDRLSPEEQKAVRAFAEQIDLADTSAVLQYGAAAQQHIADFSAGALESVRAKDLGEIGETISSLVVELKGFDTEEEKKGIRGLFRKAAESAEGLKLRYSKAETNVDRIVDQLERHQVTLLKDIAVLDQMYEKNLEYYKELTMYILAGREAVEKARTVTLPALRSAAEASGLAEDAQKANDYENLIQRFEKKLHDLELTRVVSIQMAPQIRMIQNNDTQMTEKIQTSIANTIPLWKSQMVLALGIRHSQEATAAQRAVTDVTNELLRKNAELLHTATVETARESERSVVDIETLKHTNEQLIQTFDEVLQIQADGRQKRAEAETELRRIEGELKQKLLEVRS